MDITYNTEEVYSMTNKGILIVISGPSGSGKGTIVRELTKQSSFSLSVSVTTRKPRDNEEEGTHYFFRNVDQFKEMIEDGELLEWAEFVGNYYGTPKEYVNMQLMQGKNVILEIDVQGAFSIKNSFQDCILIFIIPPSINELKNRLINRGTESKEIIAARIERAHDELKLANKYDYIVINDSIFQATQDIITIVRAEQLKSKRNHSLDRFIIGDVFNA